MTKILCVQLVTLSVDSGSSLSSYSFFLLLRFQHYDGFRLYGFFDGMQPLNSISSCCILPPRAEKNSGVGQVRLRSTGFMGIGCGSACGCREENGQIGL